MVGFKQFLLKSTLNQLLTVLWYASVH